MDGLTTRSSGRTRLSRPVQKSSTGRATRRAAERVRYTDTGPMNDWRPCPGLLVGLAISLGRTRTRTTPSASVDGGHARRPSFTQASRSPNTLVVQLASRRWQALAGVDAQNYVEDFPYNHAVNASVRPVTPLAVASVAPGRPARYASPAPACGRCRASCIPSSFSP